MLKTVFITLLLSASVAASGPESTLLLDANRMTVSGISAGGQMAHQLHISYSDMFSGAAIIASGPFGCADGSLATAMARCMGKTDSDISITELTDSIKTAELSGKIAGTKNLSNDPVWLFHGTQDTTVATQVNDATMALYQEYVPDVQIQYIKDVSAGHLFPARGKGKGCTDMLPPFVGDCNYDAAGELLQHLYPGLKTPESAPVTTLREVALDGAADAGLSDTAYIFVPPACIKPGKSCAFHLVLHGCAQSAETVGTDFIEQSGYLAWAETNDIVMAFPQVIPATLNPYACWDWWGYTGTEYRWRNGKQMIVLTEWINNL